MNDSIYSQVQEAQQRFAGHLREGESVDLKPVELPHYSVLDLGLAACLATLGIPLRDPAPFTDDVELDAKGNELGHRRCWWFSDRAESSVPGQPYLTDFLMGAWYRRADFEVDFPLHPLSAMRAALDARSFWIAVTHGRGTLPAEPKGAQEVFRTDSLNGASLLKACGYQPLAFSGRAFCLERYRNGVHATQLLASATHEGQTPERFMSRVMLNYDAMKKFARKSSTILRQNFGDQTLLLSADSTPRVRDQMHSLLS